MNHLAKQLDSMKDRMEKAHEFLLKYPALANVENGYFLFAERQLVLLVYGNGLAMSIFGTEGWVQVKNRLEKVVDGVSVEIPQ